MLPGDAAFKEHRREQGADGVATSREARTVVKHGTSRDAQWALMRRFADVNPHPLDDALTCGARTAIQLT
jgi:hypothetical protein